MAQVMNKHKLQQLVRYENGKLYWIVNNKFQHRKGMAVGSPNSGGYILTSINRTKYAVHRLIWLLHHGCMPIKLDHKDGNPANNLITNLRLCTTSQNAMNRKIAIHNTSGCTGVHWHGKKWEVRIMIQGKRKSLGSYDNIFDAACARKSAELKYFKEWRKL